MTGKRWILLVSGVALFVPLVLAALLVLEMLGAFGPSLFLVHKGNAIVAHVETLGEYPTTILHVRIEEAGSRKIAFEAVVKPEFAKTVSGQFRHFSLVPGRNSVYLWPSASEAYTIVTPTANDNFTLRRGVTYRVRVWNGSPLARGREFTF